ncbi:hypothetical protein FISHEDRAFT_68466 [Fistulina hepatica ATCC 64428]|uniref:NACHT domain-containing protein n=1 Tax=Fistulina hepatica ATCC 64428 TaxID=1128425 RepID=A0A0D7ASV8_9AGAR|nr:hypothetical protein FISHEDRAFT_68466 [Fistulina hepatica ATCC 64428]
MAPDHDVEWPPFDDDDVREILLRYGPVAASLLSDLSDVLGIGHLKPIAFLAEAIALKAVRAVSKKAQCHLLGKKILQLVGGYIFACRAQQSFFSPLHLRIAIEFSNKFQAVYILIESCQRGHKTTDSDDVFLELIRDLENLKHYLVEDEYFARAISFPERHYRYVVKIKNVLGTGYFPCSPVSLTSAEAAKCQCDRLLPAQGRRLLGRDRELKILLFPVHRSLPVRQRICGPRGVGKTALALSFVHHESVRSAYEHRRFFVCCDAARSVDDLKACIARHLDLHSHDVLVYLRDLCCQGPALLILDHLDPIWEDESQRPALVKFLLQLSHRTRMSFIITVTAWIDTEDSCLSIWSQPLLHPLRPLAPNDALELMSVVAAQSPRTPYFYELLTSAKGLPFVLTMFGNLMGFHGSTHVWTSWSNWVTTTDLKPFEGSRTREATAFAQTCCLSGAPKEAQEFLDVLSMAPDGVDVSLISKFIPDSVELHKCCRSLKLLGFAQSTRDRQVLVSPLPVRTSVKRSRAQGTQGVKRMCDGLVLALRLYSTVGLAPSSNIVRHIKENVNNIASFLADAAEDPTLDEDDLMSLILGTIEFGRFSRHTGWFPGAKASLARFGDRMLHPETTAKVKGEFFLGMAQWPETQDYYLHCAENVYTKVNDASGLGEYFLVLHSEWRLKGGYLCRQMLYNPGPSVDIGWTSVGRY